MNDSFQQGRIGRFVIVVAALTAGCIVLFSDRTVVRAEEPAGADCKRCHTCAEPTPEQPCLPKCSRVEAAAAGLAEKDGSDFIVLDMLKAETEGPDRFGPVPFDHKGHAKWAAISGGCATCHHYTPEGVEHPACRTCHLPSLVRDDLSKPSLKGAYHRQCMGCHREWSHNTECVACHVNRVGDNGEIKPADLMPHRNPPIPEPNVHVYECAPSAKVGSMVTFDHKRHSYTYGLACAECHTGDNCSRCHSKGDKALTVAKQAKPRTGTEAHRECSICHKETSSSASVEQCQSCHHDKGKPAPAPFDHASTGWPLNRYHQGNTCRDCHKTPGAFVKLDQSCASCHSNWEPGEFDHAVTGQVLDENHEEIDCGDCHTDNKYDAKPVCTECHEEKDDDGNPFLFPSKRPGPVVTPKPAGKE